MAWQIWREGGGVAVRGGTLRMEDGSFLQHNFASHSGKSLAITGDVTYVFPTVFARKVLWTRLSLCERRATSVVLFVAVACSIFATASVVANTAQHFAGATGRTGRLAPFTCSGQGHTAA